MTPPKHDPISTLGNALGKVLTIKCKRNKKFKGKLTSYDTHLNVLLTDVEYKYYSRKEDSEEYEEHIENIPEIILRGDSVVFIGIHK